MEQGNCGSEEHSLAPGFPPFFLVQHFQQLLVVLHFHAPFLRHVCSDIINLLLQLLEASLHLSVHVQQRLPCQGLGECVEATYKLLLIHRATICIQPLEKVPQIFGGTIGSHSLHLACVEGDVQHHVVSLL